MNRWLKCALTVLLKHIQRQKYQSEQSMNKALRQPR